jgi:hypothetical protein
MQNAEQVRPEPIGAILLDGVTDGALPHERGPALGGITSCVTLVRTQARQGDEHGGDLQEKSLGIAASRAHLVPPSRLGMMAR